MKILILGASGVIGSALVSYFKSFKSQSEIVITSLSSKQLNLLDVENIEQFLLKNGKFNCVVFLIGLAHFKGKKGDYDNFNNVNYMTLVNLLNCMENKGLLPDKFIFSSSISIYGERLNKVYYDEDSKKNPSSPYALTKLKAENFLIANYRTISWILRFAPVYSESFKLNLNRRTKIFNCLYRAGNGEYKLTLCNLKNINSTMMNIIENKIPYGIYNLADKNVYSYNQLLALQDKDKIIPLPLFALKFLYIYAISINSIFLKENLIKLISDNIYPVNKILQYSDLEYNLDN